MTHIAVRMGERARECLVSGQVERRYGHTTIKIVHEGNIEMPQDGKSERKGKEARFRCLQNTLPIETQNLGGRRLRENAVEQ